ncbi:MAG: hypothetical protein ACERKD_01605 [Prolixibacteraceae bacterium]
MILKINNRIKTGALLLLMLFIGTSCNDLLNNPLQDKETGEDLSLLLLDMNVFDTKINIHLIDNASEDYVTDDEFTVIFDGKDADKLVDTDGHRITQVIVKNGFYDVFLDPNYIPSDANPIEFMVFAISKSNQWISTPQEVSIMEIGNTDIVMELSKLEGGEEFLDDENEFRANVNIFENSNLKSSTTNGLAHVDTPFKLSLTCPGGVIEYPQGFASGAYYYYNYYKPNNWTAPKSVVCKAYNLDDPDKKFQDYGFMGWYYVNGSPSLIGQDGTLATLYDKANTNNFGFYTQTKRAALKCAKGLKVKITEANGMAGSSQFEYKITFADGSVKKGIITGNFKASNQYTVTKTIAPIYYPDYDAKAKVEITCKGTYSLDKQSSDISTACDGLVQLNATPIVGLKPYKLVTTLTCESGNVGAAPSMRGTVSGPGLKGAVPFEFENGIVTINLMPNENYNINGTYQGKSASFVFTTKNDATTINSVRKATLDKYPELAELTIKFAGIEADGKTERINLGVKFTSASCPF